MALKKKNYQKNLNKHDNKYMQFNSSFTEKYITSNINYYRKQLMERTQVL